MNTAVEISIIVTLYNKEKYIARCLDSIFVQTYSNYEVVVVNDCSTDASLEIVQRYCERYPDKCRIINNERNMKLGSSRRIGFENAVGRYIVFVDADDTIDKRFCEMNYRKIQEDDYDYTICGYSEVSSTGERIRGSKLPQDLEGIMTDQKRLILSSYYGEMVSFCARMYKKEFLARLNYPFLEGCLYQEDIIVSIFPLLASKIGILEDELYKYWNYQDSMSHIQRDNTKDIIKTVSTFWRLTIDIKLLNSYREYVEYLIFVYGFMDRLRVYLGIYGDNEIYLYPPQNKLKILRHVLHKYFPTIMSNPYYHLIDINMRKYIELLDQSVDDVITQYYGEWMTYYIEYKEAIEELLKRLQSQGKAVATWGAGKKGKAFLRLFDTEGKFIKYVIDSNSKLWGRKIDETHIVCGYDDVKDKINVVLVINESYYQEIWETVGNSIKLIEVDRYLKFGY